MASSPAPSRDVHAIVAVNGARLPNTCVRSLEVTNRAHFTADTFRLELATSGLPADLGEAYWADSQGDQVALAVELDDDRPFDLILGAVDDVEVDWTGRRVTLTGRDLSAQVLDNRTDEKFQNQTSSQIAQALATRRGLASEVADTATLAGTYYEIDHAVLAREQTEWELLVYLAEREGFDARGAGDTLHFEPAPVETSTPYTLRAEKSANGYACNGGRLSLNRSQTLAKDVRVVVQSYNQKRQTKLDGYYRVHRPGVSTGKPQLYVFQAPNLDQGQADRLAKAYAEQITRHERVITATLPGDNYLSTRMLVHLAGTGTAFDQLYYPD